MSHFGLNEKGNRDPEETKGSTDDDYLYDSLQKRCAEDPEWPPAKSSRLTKLSETNSKNKNKDSWCYAMNVFSPKNLSIQCRRTPFSQILSRLNFSSPTAGHTPRSNSVLKTNEVNISGQLCIQKKSSCQAIIKKNLQSETRFHTSNYESNEDVTRSPCQREDPPSPIKGNISDEEQTEIVWSESDDETPCVCGNNESALKIALDPDYELDLLIAAIKNDKRKVSSIRQRVSETKESYLEQCRAAIERGKASRSFLAYEQRTGICEGVNAVIEEVGISYGVRRVNAKLEDDSRCLFLINKCTQPVKVGGNLKLFVDSSKRYLINGVEVFVEPNKVLVN